MKVSYKFVLSILVVLCLTLSSCDLFGSNEPETTFTSKTNLDGSITEITKTVFDNGNETIDEKTTFLDGSVSEKHTKIEMDDGGNVTEESKETINYSQANTSGKKSETIEFKKSNDSTKGECLETTTTTNFKNNLKIISSSKTEGRTGYQEVSEETIRADKSSTKVVTISKDDETVGYTGSKEITEKDSSGNLTTATKIVFDTQERDKTFEGTVKATRTTKTYINGQISSTIVETLRDVPGNDRSYIREVKNSTGITTLKEMEYKFDNSITEHSGTIIFKSENSSSLARVKTGNFTGEIEHQAFVTTRDSYITKMKIKDTSITIISEGGKTVNASYTSSSDLRLSFGSKFN